METEKRSRYLLAWCTLAGLLASIVISGLLFSLDFISKTPFGTFFAVIGSSLVGQGAIFWKKLIPYGLKRGIIMGVITGISLWLVLFLPLTTYVIQPKLDMFNLSAPNQYVFVIAQHFQGLYAVVLLGSFFFHVIYGIILGLIAGSLVKSKH